ncbi:MAG: antitoxin VapB family protein [Acidobacteria bacterium]|nr:antitoxin VapB family protein [Acidobacteriota bacterium]
MAVKTITIDIEAYELLSRNKRAGQSFSQVIREHFGIQPTAKRFIERMRSIRFDEATLDAMESQVRARRLEPARAVRR